MIQPQQGKFTSYTSGVVVLPGTVFIALVAITMLPTASWSSRHPKQNSS